MSFEAERSRVRARVKRLHERCAQIFGLDGGEELRLALETELVMERREAFLEGKRDGFKTARTVQMSAQAQSPRDPDATPVNPTDWYGGGRKP